MRQPVQELAASYQGSLPPHSMYAEMRRTQRMLFRIRLSSITQAKKNLRASSTSAHG